MALLYPYNERKTARRNIKRMRALSDTLLAISKGDRPANPELQAGVAALTGNTDMASQYAALVDMANGLERTHIDRLIALAPDDLTAFAEVMAPHEPPADHHIFMAEKLMQAEANPGSRLMISMPPGHAKDLDVNTPVMMGTGSWKRLGDVRIGEQVITHKGRPQEVLAVHDQGIREVLKITTASGRTVRAHPEHVFLTPTDWIEAGKLKVGMTLALPRGITTEGSRESAHRDEFVLAGYLFARAVVSGPAYSRLHKISRKFRCNSPAIRDDVRDTAVRLGFAVEQRRDPTGHDREALLLTFDYAMMDWAVERDLYGMKKTDARVPQWIYEGSEADIGAFLGALVSCDATFVPERNKHTGWQRKMQLACKENPLLRDDLVKLFLRIGVKADPYDSRSTNYNYDPTVFYKLNVTDATAMAVMQKRLRIVGPNLARWRQDLVVREFASPDYWADQITSITPDGTCETRCLTVETDASFLADGIVVHNSTYSSRYYPAWYLGRDERRRYLQAGHTQDFAEKEFGKKTRDLIGTPEFQSVFPGVVVRYDTKAAGLWMLTNGNQYTVKGVGQGISGVRSTNNGVDDPYPTKKEAESETYRKKTWNWFANDFMTRLLPGGSAMIIATRWHVDDLIGAIEQKQADGELHDHWEIINLPALCLDPDTDQMRRQYGEPLWPDFYTQETLQAQRSLMTTTEWSCLYEGSPLPAEGNVIKRQWLKHADYYPIVHVSSKQLNWGRIDQEKAPGDPTDSKPGQNPPKHGDPTDSGQGTIPYTRTTVSVDSAESEDKRADFSAITVWRETTQGYHYLVDAFRARMEFTTLCSTTNAMAEAWDADFILMEKKGAGQQYIQAIGDKGLAPCAVIPCDPTRKGDKVFRMDGASVYFQQGKVILPNRAPWLSDYEREILQFPNAKNDDYADSTSQYLNWRRANSSSGNRGTKKLSPK
jgi:predicted phage terminase large subunit-like protein